MTTDLLFYRVPVEYGCFSNFAPWKVFLMGKVWPTTEHFFQAMKFLTTDLGYTEDIRAAGTPRWAATMGRTRSRPLRPDWESVKDDYMRLAVVTKFSDHGRLTEILLATGDRKIIEDTRTSGDAYWGWGSDMKGKNMLGIILMEVREALRTGPAIDYIKEVETRLAA